MASSKSLVLASSVLCVLIFSAGLMIIIPETQLRYVKNSSIRRCLLFMSSTLKLDNSPCDFVLGATIISCILVAAVSFGYYVFGLVKGGSDEGYYQSMLTKPLVGIHAVMAVLQFIVGVVVTLGFSNFCKLVPKSFSCSSYPEYSQLMPMAIGAWIAFIFWCILTFVSFKRM